MIYETTLSNGLELVFRKTNAPVASFQVWVDVGSIDENPEEAGFCHFLEHMLFKGTKTRTTGEIAGTVEGSGGEMNAFTSFEYTVYYITLSNKKWQVANNILSDMLFQSTFVKSEFDPEKEVILEEIKRGNDSPDRQLYQLLYSKHYGSTGYGRPVIGFPKTVSRCSEKTLKKFWNKWYSPELMTLVVCGDLEYPELLKTVEKTWGAFKSKKPLRQRRRDISASARLKTLANQESVIEFPVKTVRWIGTFPGEQLRSSDLAVADLALTILGQGDSSRLYNTCFQKNKEVLSISAGSWSSHAAGLLTFDAEVSMQNGLNFKKTFKNILNEFAEHGPTKEELERAKVGLENERIYSAQSMESLANRIGFLKTSLGNSRFDLEYLNELREVTSNDIKNWFKKALQWNQFSEFYLIPKETKELGKDKFLELLKKSEVLSEKTEKNKIIKKDKINSKQPQIVKISDSLEIALSYRDDLPIVSIQACMPGGLLFENKKNWGVHSIISEIWEKGPEGMTPEQFAEKMEAKASRISSFSGRSSVGLSCSTLTHYQEDVIPLYFKTLFKPNLDKNEFSHAKTLAEEELKSLQEEPNRMVGRMFCEALFGEHPYAQSTLGTFDSLKRLEAQFEIEKFKKNITQSKISIGICGKFDEKIIFSEVEKYKSLLSISKNTKEIFPKHELHFPKADRLTELKKNREQSHLILGFKGLSIRDDERHAMRVLMTILSGQSGRLFRELRDKKGLCYTVSPISFEGVDSGYFGVYIGCDPKKREEALQGIHYELQRVAKQKISSEEFKRAKEFLKGRHHMDSQLNSSISTSMAFNLLYGVEFDEHLKFDEFTDKVSVSDVQKLMSKLIAQPSVTSIVV